MLSNLMTRIRNFAKDQGGMEAIQAVALVAIGAMILIGAINLGSKANTFANTSLDNLETKAGDLAGDSETPGGQGAAGGQQQQDADQDTPDADDAGDGA